MINPPPVGLGRPTNLQAPDADAAHGANAPRANAPRSGMASNISAVFNRAGQSLASALGGLCNFAHSAGCRLAAAIKSVFAGGSKAASESSGPDYTEMNLKSALRSTERDLNAERSARTVQFEAEAQMVEFNERQRVNVVATLSHQLIPTKDEALPMLSSDTAVAASLHEVSPLLPDGNTASVKAEEFSIDDPTSIHWASSRGAHLRKRQAGGGAASTGDESIHAAPKDIVDRSKLR